MQSFIGRFMATKGFVSNAIKWVEGVSYIDHTEFKNRKGTGWIGAHAGIGVRDMPLDWTKQEEIVWERQYTLMVPDSSYELMMAFAESKVGVTSYDYAAIMGILFRNRSLDDDRRLMCSCFHYQTLHAGGIYALNVLPQYGHLVTPETLHLSPIYRGKMTYSFPAFTN
jgi:hypothetical protein